MTLRQRPVADAIPRARALRSNMTDAERKLWSMLRGRQIGDVKFRRQAPLGRYIADFLCSERKLVIEADGGLHSIEKDADRTAFLESQGFRVLRFRNGEIMCEPDSVWRTIEAALQGDRPLPPRQEARVASPLKGEESLPRVRGRITADAPLAPLVWFKTGGAAETLFEPADADNLRAYLEALDPATPILPLGLGSNLIVRDGGFDGVAIRLGKAFAGITVDGDLVRAGGGAPGIAVASAARDASLSGLEFLRGIPGTAGGAVRMNAGAYGRDVSDILVEATVVRRERQRNRNPARRCLRLQLSPFGAARGRHCRRSYFPRHPRRPHRHRRRNGPHRC